MPLFGPPNIDKLKETRNIEGLRKATTYRRADIRLGAAQALLDMEGERALDVVLPLLQDEDREVRLALAKAVAPLADQRARVGLMKMLADPDETVRITAAQLLEPLAGLWMTTLAVQLAPRLTERMRLALAAMLGKLDREAAISQLLPHADDAERGVRLLVGAALDALGWEPAGDVGAAYWVERGQWERCAALGMAAAPPLVKALLEHVSDIDARADIQRVLKEIGWKPGQNATSALYWLVTWQWQKIVDIGAEAVPALLEALHHPHSLVREHAVLALGQIGDQRALAPLLERLENGPVTLRPIVIEALGLIGDERAIAPLRQALQSDEASTAAVRALGHLGALEALDEMISFAARDLNEHRLKTVVESLHQLGPDAVEPLIAIVRNKDGDSARRAVAVAALRSFNDERARPALLEAAQDNQATVRAAANQALFGTRQG